MICQQHQELVKPVQAFTVELFHYNKKEAEGAINSGVPCGYICKYVSDRLTVLLCVCVCVFTRLLDTSRVVHMHEEHVLIPVQDGVKLQTHKHTYPGM